MTRAIAAAAVLAGLLAASTSASAAESGKARTVPGLVLAECGACHIAYLPRFLPGNAWQTLFDNLDNHFGENAHLPADELAVIRRYYADRAAWGSWTPAAGQTLPRITALPWWKRAMGKLDVSKPRIRSRANCGACHTHADWYMGVRD